MPDASRPRLFRVVGREQWYIKHRGRRVSTGCTDRAEAERVLARYASAGSAPQIAAKTLSSLLAAYLDDRRERAAPGATRLAYAHAAIGRHIGRLPPEAVSERVLKSYTASRRADRVSLTTVRTELQALRAALLWAVKKRLIAQAPEVPLPPRPEARDRWLTRIEVERLLAACADHHLRLFILLALHTAARSSAILALTWGRVDMDGRRIDLRAPGQSAAKRAVRVPVNNTLHAALVEAHAVATSAYVIEWGGNRVQRIIKGFRAAARRAGLDDVTPHTLRHTAATWMMQAGIPTARIAAYLGHTSERMVEQTYAHHHPDFMGDAARALG